MLRPCVPNSQDVPDSLQEDQSAVTAPETDVPAGDPDADLSPKWRLRFQFFRTHGTPPMWTVDREWGAAVKALGFRDRMRITQNGYAYLFGVLYLLYLGMWRRALTVLAVAAVCTVIAIGFDLPYEVDTAAGMGIAAYLSVRVNVLYYRHRDLGDRGWGL